MSFKIFLLCLLAILMAFWGYLRWQAGGDPNSYFNQATRYQLGKHGTFRWLLGLNLPGDSRGEYLTGSEPLIVELVQAKGLEIDEEGFRKFVSQVEKLTGRSVQVYNVDVFDNKGELAPQDLSEIVRGFRRHKQLSQPNLFIIYAQDFEHPAGHVADTYRDFGIVVSHKRLSDSVAQYRQAIREYLPAVLLHQFGLQLGLSVNNDAQCVMNQELDKPKPAFAFNGWQAPSQPCSRELDQLNGIKASLK